MSLYEERKRLEQEDGEPLDTLRVTPDSDAAVQCNGAGILIVAGEGGITKAIEDALVTPLAQMGYFVVAIGVARNSVIEPELAIDDISSALLYLKELAGGKLGVFGLDGATPVVIEAATRLPQIDCVVVSGGPGPRKGVKLSRSRSSMLMLRGTRTSPVTDAVCLEMSRRLEPAMQRLMIQNFDASDGFLARPADDERDYASEAFDHASSFLAQNLI